MVVDWMDVTVSIFTCNPSAVHIIVVESEGGSVVAVLNASPSQAPAIGVGVDVALLVRVKVRAAASPSAVIDSAISTRNVGCVSAREPVNDPKGTLALCGGREAECQDEAGDELTGHGCTAARNAEIEWGKIVVLEMMLR
ncbi:uncharacterized protein PV09_02390 [Verruconis gallopava]|uniref:Uncharacterized protein n=1 Tax=Verruconis gallopava TaxID=253628 RepID=A0A0D2AJD0_9PEZI|nr:uncharacterized protein PV09_02390 [Verruconis gallopava]KIW06685.1 hypothetical protein PV09_02390 [Verruconis gallopava]